MKTERRHELQTNRLADWLGHQLDDVRPHGKKILGAAVLGAALLITAMVIVKDREAALSVAWDDFYLALAARDRDALASVAKTHGGSVVALWARQAQADLDLMGGISALYTNRDEAFKSLEDARQGYSDVVKESSSYPELTRHSMLGLAQAHEATGNLEKARDFYQKVVQQFPGSPMANEATSRLEALKDPQVDKWYNWFARQNPKPRTGPLGAPPTGLPTGLGNLPDMPDLPPVTIPESPVSRPSTASPDESAAPASDKVGTQSAANESTGAQEKAPTSEPAPSEPAQSETSKAEPKK